MTLEVGSIVEGTVIGITNFGAFIELPNGKTGLVHISEVADTFVEDIRQFLKERDKVQVKILGINEKGKYDLSIKQLNKATPPPEQQRPPSHSHGKEKRRYVPPEEMTFEDKLTKYLKESEERLLDLKRNTEAKRGRGRTK
ncbi:MAG: S1 RNA-binding domain-containing protein [Candidatus Eremiobacteraeota bacterium]|nr:S1 RNA-binding domain-containing protein [Candidatus Eremiobacteraeota bacterium]